MIKRFAALIFAFLLAFCLAGCSERTPQEPSDETPSDETPSDETPPVTEGESFALFIYMSGADLESGSGAASSVLAQLKEAQRGTDVEVVVQTGGSLSWKDPEVDASSVDQYRIEDGSLEKIASLGDRNMGEAETLGALLDLADESDASHKVLLFWGHGSPYGICPDSRFQDDMLTYSELASAMGTRYFDLIIFNACYTASVDLMCFLADSAAYAIASEEVLPSLGYDYAAMLSLFDESEGKTMEEIGRQIVEDARAKYEGSTLRDSLTLSLIDLGCFREGRATLERYFWLVLQDVSSWLRTVSAANSIGDIGKDVSDIGRLHEGETPDELAALAEQAVVFEVHGLRERTNGLYLYYRERGGMLGSYEPNCAIANYYSILEHRSELAEQTYIDYKYVYDSGEYFVASLDDRAVNYAAHFRYAVYCGGRLLKVDSVGSFAGYSAASGSTEIQVAKSALSRFSLGELPLEDVTLLNSLSDYYPELGAEWVTNYYAAPLLRNGRAGRLIFAMSYISDPSRPDFGAGGFRAVELIGYVPDGGSYIELLEFEDTLTSGGETVTYVGGSISIDPLPADCTVRFYVDDIYGTVYESKDLPVA